MWLFHWFSQHFPLIMYWFCWEKIDFGHSWDLKGYINIPKYGSDQGFVISGPHCKFSHSTFLSPCLLTWRGLCDWLVHVNQSTQITMSAIEKPLQLTLVFEFRLLIVSKKRTNIGACPQNICCSETSKCFCRWRANTNVYQHHHHHSLNYYYHFHSSCDISFSCVHCGACVFS